MGSFAEEAGQPQGGPQGGGFGAEAGNPPPKSSVPAYESMGFVSAPAASTGPPEGKETPLKKAVQIALMTPPLSFVNDIPPAARTVVTPFAQLLRQARALPKGFQAAAEAGRQTPQERQDAIRAGAATLGILTGTKMFSPVAEAAAGLGPGVAGALAGMASGGVGGVVQSGVETGGNVPAMALSGLLGMGMGGAAGGFHGALPEGVKANLRAANPLSAVEARLGAMDNVGNQPARMPNYVDPGFGPVARARIAGQGTQGFPVPPPEWNLTPMEQGRNPAWSSLPQPERGLPPRAVSLPAPAVSSERLLANPARYSRLRGLTPTPSDTPLAGPGRSLAAMNREAEVSHAVAAGMTNDVLDRAGLHKLSDEQASALRQALEGHQPSEEGPASAVADAFRSETSGWPAEARAAGLPTGTVPDYYPRYPVPDRALRSNKGKTEMARGLVQDGFADTPEEGLALTKDWLTLRDSGGEKGGELIAAALARKAKEPIPLEAIRQGQTPQEAPTVAEIRAIVRSNKGQKFSSADFQRTALSSMFYDRDPRRVLPIYVEGMRKRISEAQVFGPGGEKVQEQVNRFPTTYQRELASEQSAVARGSADLPDPGLSGSLARGLRRGGSTLMSPLTSIRNLTQGVTLTPIVTSPRATAAAYADLPGSMAISKHSGSVSSEAMGRYGSMLGGDIPVTGRFLKGIGMEVSEKVNRGSSSGAAGGKGNYAQDMADMLRDPNPAKREFAANELGRLMVRPEDIVGGRITPVGLRRAAYMATRRSQFTMVPGVLPEFMTKGEAGKTMSQFRSFPFQTGRTLWQETADRLRSPNPYDRARGFRNLAILGTIFPLAGEGSADLRALIGGRKRSTSLRDMLAGKARLSDFGKRYGENMQEVGGFGLAGDVTSSLDYNPLEMVAGPSVSTAVHLAQDVNMARKGKKIPRSELRRAIRVMVPGVGPLIQNVVVPPTKKGGKK